eukprot:CAMPEP_0117875840 /NCGR_PEP_ID=MMETSP0950-20121206/13201_1 /TAXON_ID=44440 /ORGANISM="Chattonella subsalsa, Strain CCMP2191" /LENGTH=163 /DNA_ID=CAMNT_0005729447 /DNA_START=27 /DNA_END=518 /DNA_ORIENTATION=-
MSPSNKKPEHNYCKDNCNVSNLRALFDTFQVKSKQENIFEETRPRLASVPLFVDDATFHIKESIFSCHSTGSLEEIARIGLQRRRRVQRNKCRNCTHLYISSPQDHLNGFCCKDCKVSFQLKNAEHQPHPRLNFAEEQNSIMKAQKEMEEAEELSINQLIHEV